MDNTMVRLFSNLFASVAEEMGTVLGRTAYSANIKERCDFSCALFDADLRLVAEGSHIPVHLGAIPLSVREIVERVDLEEGDVAITNDPFAGGTHLPDITLLTPIFYDNVLVGYSVSRAHHSDVGSKFPGSMGLGRSIHQEGVRIKPTKLVEGGVLNRPFLKSFLERVRNSNERLGDLKAQLASNNAGALRFKELIANYGLGEIGRQIDFLIAYTKKHTGLLLQSFPDGNYDFADCLDNDGFNEKAIGIDVAITIEKDSAKIDFSKSDSAAEGCVNATLAVTLSAVYYVFRCLLPSGVPANHGTFYPITIIAPEGSIVNAVYPSAVAAGNVETSQRIVDVVLGALAKAVPDRIPAASQGTMNNICFGFTAPDGNENTYYETVAGGMGAFPGHNGLSGVQTHMTNTLNTPIEALELLYPIRVLNYGLRKGSGGGGQAKGGDGIIRSFELLEDGEISILSERRNNKPYGLSGGQPGATGCNSLTSAGIKRNLPGKISLSAKPGDTIIIETPGGGGFGFVTDKP